MSPYPVANVTMSEGGRGGWRSVVVEAVERRERAILRFAAALEELGGDPVTVREALSAYLTVVEGLGYTEAARRLGVQSRTVETHLATVAAKCGESVRGFRRRLLRAYDRAELLEEQDHQQEQGA